MGRNCLVLFICFCLFSFEAVAKKGKYNDVSKNVYHIDVLDVVDGDTLFVEIYYTNTLSEKINIRLIGIDTPEKGGNARCDDEKVLAREATKFMKGILLSAEKQGKKFFINGVKKDKYGNRIDANVYFSDGEFLGNDVVNVAGEMLKTDLAVSYNGGRKLKNWCD
ncbi:MAG: thermonuclease family protein [Alphaproteobacteria bacterium]|jgi:endonuclease YncB( thermonuclease family)|nr:thermonuclease family protein [Alphaproteobacteria bacterium]